MEVINMKNPTIIRILIDDENTFELAEHFIVDEADKNKLIKVIIGACEDWFDDDKLADVYEGMWYYVLAQVENSGIKAINTLVEDIEL
jgi:hypothetical protein